MIWLSVALATAILFFRLSLRFARFRRLLADDYSLLIAVVLTISLAAMHTESLPPLATLRLVSSGAEPPPSFPSQLEYLFRVQFAAKLLYWLVFYTVKLSLLVFLRTFLFALGQYRKWWYLALALVLLGAVGSFVGSITECTPIWRNFSLEDGCDKPSDLRASRIVLTTLTVWDVLTDFVIIVLPLPLLFGMRKSLTPLQLGSLLLVFSSGLLIVAFSIQRIVRVWQNSSVDDFAWQVTVAITWAQTEAAVAVFVGTLPAFKMFWTSAMVSPEGSSRRRQGVLRSLNTFVSSGNVKTETTDVTESTTIDRG